MNSGGVVLVVVACAWIVGAFNAGHPLLGIAIVIGMFFLFKDD